MRSETINKFEVTTDGKTLWVNSPEGQCVGRFSSRAGFELEIRSQRDIKTGPPDDKDWEHFVRCLNLGFDVEIPSDMRPEPYRS